MFNWIDNRKYITAINKILKTIFITVDYYLDTCTEVYHCTPVLQFLTVL